MATHDGESAARGANARKKPFYRTLWGQVLIGVAIGIVLGYVRPGTAVAMKPLGDAFIRVISMVITLVIFCTIVTGITPTDRGREGVLWPNWPIARDLISLSSEILSEDTAEM